MLKFIVLACLFLVVISAAPSPEDQTQLRNSAIAPVALVADDVPVDDLEGAEQYYGGYGGGHHHGHHHHHHGHGGYGGYGNDGYGGYGNGGYGGYGGQGGYYG